MAGFCSQARSGHFQGRDPGRRSQFKVNVTNEYKFQEVCPGLVVGDGSLGPKSLAEKPGQRRRWRRWTSFQANDANNNNQDLPLSMSSVPASRSAAAWARSRALARTTPRRMDFAARLSIQSDDSGSEGSTQPDDSDDDAGARSSSRPCFAAISASPLISFALHALSSRAPFWFALHALSSRAPLRFVLHVLSSHALALPSLLLCRLSGSRAGDAACGSGSVITSIKPLTPA